MIRRRIGSRAGVLALALVCTVSTTALGQEDDDEFYLDGAGAGTEVSDPFESFNRGIFCVNDCLDMCFLEPLADTWDFFVPDVAQRSLRRAFDNLRFPVVFLNDLLQGKPKAAGVDLTRFLVNTTAGVGGLMDPAQDWFDLEKHNEDFGQTLGYWGVPPGPFLMLPILGPSNLRDGIGSAVDAVTGVIGWFVPFAVTASLAGTDTLNRRSLVGDQISQERAAALDWYAAVRSAYSQYRENLIQDDAAAVDQESPFITPEAP